MPDVYFDTNIIRYLGKSLRNKELPAVIRSRLVLSQLSALELMSQLSQARPEAREVFDAIQTMWNWLRLDNARVLDWPTTFLAVKIFDIPTPQDETFERLTQALTRCLHAPNPDVLREDAVALHELRERLYLKAAKIRRDEVIRLRRRKIKPHRADLVQAFAQELARRVNTSLGTRNPEEIVHRLEAYYEFETGILQIALKDHRFNFLSKKRMNDVVDAEQLVYLADNRLHYLTTDGSAYRRIKGTSEGHRVHIEKPVALMETPRAIALLEQLTA